MNVVNIYESGQADDGTPYIAMEFLEGESLRQALARRGALPVPEVAEILQQAARGLNAAHKLGIIHRDLKPDNIFLTYPDDAAAPLPGAHDEPAIAQDVGAGLVPALPVGIADSGRAQGPPLRPVVVKLVDFGIAKLRESGMQTQTGTVLGTPVYMSFEQASGMRSDELDARSDVYSLGVVVYEMLTGRTPFHSETPVGYLRMHMQEAPPPFRGVKPELTALAQLESVVMKALTKDRDQRYTSVLEFAREFVQPATGNSEPVAQPEPQREAAKPQPQTTVTPAPKTRQHLWTKIVMGLAGLCALGVLGGGGYYISTRYSAWRGVWTQTRTCREWESKHPVGSPLDIDIVNSGTIVWDPPPGCSGPLEDAYNKRQTAWGDEQRKNAAMKDHAVQLCVDQEVALGDRGDVFTKAACEATVYELLPENSTAIKERYIKGASQRVRDCVAKSTHAANIATLLEQREQCTKNPNNPIVLDFSKANPIH